MKKVSIEIDNHVATVRLSRPDKLNALDIEMFDEIIAAGQVVQNDKTVRVVVLHGQGRAFCAGLDLQNLMAAGQEFLRPLSDRTHGMANRWQQAVWTWRECDVPVIAAVHGVAFGGGLQIMSGADIRIIHPDTRLSIMELKWGIIPDMGGTQLWRHNVRDDVLREMIYTHKEFDGSQAVAYGFATRTHDEPLEEAIRLAKDIASKSPSAIVQAKNMLNQCHYLGEEDGLLLESILQDKIIRKENQMEAVMSQMQKRQAEYQGYRK